MVHRYGNLRAGIGLTEQARSWDEVIAWQAKSEFGLLDPKAAYEMHIVMHLSKNSRDLDSVIPLVPNAVCKGVGINDNRIFRIVLEKVVDGERFLEVWLKSDS